MRCPVAAMVGNSLVMQNPCWTNANTYPSPWNFQLLSWLENAPEFLTQPNMWYLDPYSQQLTYYNPTSSNPRPAILPVLETLISLQGSPTKPVANITFKGLQFAYATSLQPKFRRRICVDQSGNILIGGDYQANVIGHQAVVYKTPGNVSLTFARNITFNHNTFSYLGGTALDIGTGSQKRQGHK